MDVFILHVSVLNSGEDFDIKNKIFSQREMKRIFLTIDNYQQDAILLQDVSNGTEFKCTNFKGKFYTPLALNLISNIMISDP